MKKLDFTYDPYAKPDLLIKVLQHVQVPWLQDWVEHLAIARNQARYQFIIEANLCKAPVKSSDAYILGLLSPWNFGLSDPAQEDSDFLNHSVWRFFEVEGSGEQSLAALDQYCKKPERLWSYRMKRWSEDGRVSRSRLLDASLDALSRDFTQFRAGWFSRFHEYMAPDPQERVARTDRYLALLESTIPPTVSFALDNLKLIDPVKPLTAVQLTPRVGAVLRGKTKGNSLGILSLVETILARESQHRSTLLNALLGGLLSDTVEIQLKIVKLLLKYSAELDAEIKTRLGEMEELFVPSARKLITPLLSNQRNAGLKRVQRHAGLIVEPIPESQSERVPILDAARVVVPIQSHEELVERASFVIENPQDWAEVERVFSALVKLPISGDPTIQKLAKPLLIRATKLFETKSEKYEESDLNWPAILRVILAWLRADDEQTHADFLRPIEEQLDNVSYIFRRGHLLFTRFHFNRLHGIIKLCLGSDRLPLLSEPTHLGFWIEPAQLVARIQLLQQAGKIPCPYDAVIALLRLAPEKQDVALEKSRGLTGELGAAFRYALGADEAIGAESHLWIAAARVRYRYKNDPQLARAFPDPGPGGAEWPQITWAPGCDELHYGFRPGDKEKKPILHRFLAMMFKIAPATPNSVPDTHLPVLLYSRNHCYPKNATSLSWPGWAFQVFASYWPGGADAIHFNSVLCAGTSTKNMDVAHLGLLIAFEALNNPDEEFGGNALLLLNLGLSSLHADGRTSSTNAAIAGITSGRLKAKALGESMRIIFTSGLILPARLRKSLDEIVRVSLTLKRAVLQYLTEVLQGDPTQAPDGTTKLLELYHELLLELNETVCDEPVLTYLRTFPGAGRGGKLAKQILGLGKS